ncbi:MAG: peptidase S9 [Luteitalea sp.]|nr:peptidase S9 [Luteitalea sp.]
MAILAPRVLRRVAAMFLVGSLGVTAADAQYFGRNKVQYKDFDFQILKTEHFDIYYYPEAREGIDIAARLAERWHARLEKLFDHQLRGRQPLVLYGSHPDFEQTNTIQGELGEGTGGVTEPLRRRIILPLGGPLADTDHVIGHELVHAFQFDITSNPEMGPGRSGIERVPLWFIEGMAEYLSIGPVDANTAMWVRDAARKETLPSIDDLDNPKYFPYRWGQAFWAYVGGKWGDYSVRQMLAIASAAGDPAVAIERVLGVTTKQLTEEWHASIRRAYEPVMAGTTPPSEAGTLIVESQKLGGNLNVGPAISPDGRLIAFLSERGLFSIDLFVADAATGEVLRKLTSTASDPHYSSIQFIHSAGAWDADSKRIAIATITSGRPALAIFNAQNGDREREVKVPGVDEIFNPTWSPDGRSICFTGMSRGLTDLFVVDLQSGAVRQLTKDPFAELQPAWSPDGQRIAFATDRFSSDLATLSIGAYRLALVDPATGRIEQTRAFTTGKNINPQWGPDSRTLFFLADRNGIPNLYRMPIDGGEITQVTNVGTGLSGITNTSPAMSIAARAGTAAFSVYDEGNYDIYTLPMALTASSAGTALGDASTAAATLPPLDRRPSEVQALLNDPGFGLPRPQEYESVDYKPGLSLVGMGQPNIAVGADRYGAAIGGGLSFFFSDMLGDHNLSAGVQLNSGLSSNFSLKNTAAQVAYMNQADRWNWGVVVGQVPYLSGGVRQSLGVVSGEPSIIDETIILRQTERSASGIVAYPFNRAQRVEFQAGVTQLSFDRIVQTQAYSLNTGQLFFDETDETKAGDTLSLGTSSAALVYDTSVFGVTSPVQGQRYRFEAAPTFGSINFTSVLADYRRYFMPATFYTLAARVMHYGRYGSSADDGRLFPLYIGYPNLVRGYDVNTISASECSPTAESSCPQFDRLIGSRMLVANLEFRFPLLRPFTGPSQSMYGPVPVEVALFADGGVAWNRDERPSIFGGGREGVSSVGVALRANLFGFAIGQFDFAKPLQRAGKGWVFQFNLSPGF